MPEKWSNQDVVMKIDWEGGLEEALRWGIRWNMIADRDLAAVWERLETYFSRYNDEAKKVWELLLEPNGDPE